MSLYALCLLVTVNFIASTSNLGLLKRDLQSDLLVAELPTGNCQYWNYSEVKIQLFAAEGQLVALNKVKFGMIGFSVPNFTLIGSGVCQEIVYFTKFENIIVP